jgi:methyl-accepting chemotaxis protein
MIIVIYLYQIKMTQVSTQYERFCEAANNLEDKIKKFREETEERKIKFNKECETLRSGISEFSDSLKPLSQKVDHLRISIAETQQQTEELERETARLTKLFAYNQKLNRELQLKKQLAKQKEAGDWVYIDGEKYKKMRTPTMMSISSDI